MRRYDGIWRTAVGVLAAIGVVAALMLVPLGAVLSTFAFVAFLSASISVSFGLSVDHPPDQVFRAAPRWAGLGGGGAVATFGYGVAAGADVLLLLLVVAGSAPPVVRWLGGTSSEVLPPMLSEDQLSRLSAAELCLAWRRSFTELSRPDHWAATIDVRGAYLDELERRYPEEFAAWLASGPRAANDPERFFNHGADA